MVTTLKDRARGAFMGLAVGDALGGPTEGKTREEILSRWGRVTDFLSAHQGGSDDTEYALFCAKLLLRKEDALTSADVAAAWRSEIANIANAYKGAGFSEIIAIQNLLDGLEPPQSGEHLHSWSDGLAMRVTPLGIASAGDPRRAAHLAQVNGSVSNSGEGIYCGQAVAAAVAAAMAGSSITNIVQAAMDVTPADSWASHAIKRGVAIGSSCENVWSALPLLEKSLVCSYYFWPDVAPEAVGLAFGIIAAARGVFEEAVLGAVNIGRDADTIAAIAGAICGAREGVGVIPERWAKRVTVSRGICISTVKGMNILSVADDLCLLAQKWNKLL